MPTDPSRPGETEYLGNAPAASSADRRPGRRLPLAGLAAGGVLGVVALGGWAAVSLMSSGTQPATALPASALAYVSVDLDPTADQKLEAMRIVDKFPALDEKLGLDAQDDLRRFMFDRSELAGCEDADYDDDVAPWVGERVAGAVLPGAGEGEHPQVVVALEVTDEEAAAASLPGLLACGTETGDEQPGFAFTDGYVLVAESAAVAEAAVDATADGALADDASFQEWTAAVGDPGIVTMYVAPDALGEMMALGQAMSGEDHWMTYGEPDGPHDGSPMPPHHGPWPGGPDHEQLQKLAEGFEGAAAVVRFEDGTVEAEYAAGGTFGGVQPTEGLTTGVTDLPATTGAALSLAFPDRWLEDWLRSMAAITGMPVEEMLREAEAQTGLELPEDLEALLGESVNVAVDSGLEVGPVLRGGDPSSLPVGIKIVGEPSEILPVVEKLTTRLGPAGQMLVVEEGDRSVSLGLNQEYVDRLATEGGLGDDAAFSSAVPDADRAASVLFVSFDAGDAWVERFVLDVSAMVGHHPGGLPSDEVRANMEALEALGVSSWVEDDVKHGLLRLTTD